MVGALHNRRSMVAQTCLVIRMFGSGTCRAFACRSACVRRRPTSERDIPVSLLRPFVRLPVQLLKGADAFGGLYFSEQEVEFKSKHVNVDSSTVPFFYLLER